MSLKLNNPHSLKIKIFTENNVKIAENSLVFTNGAHLRPSRTATNLTEVPENRGVYINNLN